MRKFIKLLTPALLLAFSFTPASQSQRICEPLCTTSPCTSNADCTAAPNGHCNLVCPNAGCCEYR